MLTVSTSISARKPINLLVGVVGGAYDRLDVLYSNWSCSRFLAGSLVTKSKDESWHSRQGSRTFSKLRTQCVQLSVSVRYALEVETAIINLYHTPYAVIHILMQIQLPLMIGKAEKYASSLQVNLELTLFLVTSPSALHTLVPNKSVHDKRSSKNVVDSSQQNGSVMIGLA